MECSIKMNMKFNYQDKAGDYYLVQKNSNKRWNKREKGEKEESMGIYIVARCSSNFSSSLALVSGMVSK